MHAHNRSLLQRGLVLILAAELTLLGAVSCKKAETPPPPPAGNPEPAPAQVLSVDLGKRIGADKRVTEPASVFSPADTIFAAVMTQGTSPSVTLGARWTFEDGQVVDESTQTVVLSGPATTEFHIMKATPWPAGKYRVDILFNGTPSMSREFEVKP